MAHYNVGNITSDLVVSVSGTFAGAARARVHSVEIGEGTARSEGVRQVTDDGDAVVVMPSTAPN